MLKHLVKLRLYLLYTCVAACHGMACVVYCAEFNSLVRFSASSLMIVEDQKM